MLEAKNVSKIYKVRDKSGREKIIYSVNGVDIKLENRDFSVLVGELSLIHISEPTRP